MIRAFDDAPPPSGPPLQRIEQFFDAYLEALAGHPALARVFLIEVYAAGPRLWSGG